MFRNRTGQKFIVYAFDATTGLPKAGDAANITTYVEKDHGGPVALTDTSATEIDATNAAGYYRVDATQAETDADVLLVTAKSTTADIVVIGAPAAISTLPATGILAPTTAGRTLDVSATGEAGIDLANVGAPTTVLNLSGLTIKTATDVETDTADIQTRIPAALVAGRMASDMIALSGDTTAADNLETAFDDTAGPVPWLGIVDQGTAQAATPTTLQLRAAAAFADDTLNGMVIGVFGSTQGYWQFRVITDYVGATDTATVDAWTVTPSGTITYNVLAAAPASTVENAAIRTALGLAAANLDTQLSAIAAYVDTEVAAIKAKTDNLPGDPADASDIAASFTSIAATLATLTGLVDDLETRLSAARAGYLDNLNPATGVTLAAAGSLALTEGYAADGAAATLPQLLYAIKALLGQFAITGTAMTTKRLDGTTTAEVYTLDSATSPTAITRAS